MTKMLNSENLLTESGLEPQTRCQSYKTRFLRLAAFRLAKFIGDIADGFACLTYLDHTPQTEMALFELRGPRKPRHVGVVV
jgi:hypothetical protein